jgi:hypothetical protein
MSFTEEKPEQSAIDLFKTESYETTGIFHE